MLSSWYRLVRRVVESFARIGQFFAVAILSVLVGCSENPERQLWVDRAAADIIPYFSRVSTPDLNAFAVASDRLNVVAVGDAGRIMHSGDAGATWMARSSGTTNRLLQVAAGRNGLVVAVGERGTIVLSRNAGASWTNIAASGTTKALRHVIVMGNGALLAIGDDGAVVRSTDNGTSWFESFSNVRGMLNHGIFLPGAGFLVVGDDGNILRSGDDGRTWHVAYASGNLLREVILEPGGALIAIGNVILRSTDQGTTWLEVNPPNAVRTLAKIIVAPDGALLAVGGDGIILRSDNGGKSWSPQLAEDRSSLLHVLAAPDGTLVALGGARPLLSPDGGKHWSGAATAADSNIADPAAAAVAVAGGSMLIATKGGAIVRSDDGVKWTQALPGTTSKSMLHIAFGTNQVLVAVGSEGAIMRSADGARSWTMQDSGTRATLWRVIAQAGGPWVAVGTEGTVVRSYDGGVSWLAVTNSGTASELRDIVAGNAPGSLIAVGVNGTIVRSIDGGENWDLVGSPTKNDLRQILAYQGILIAVGSQGTVIRSKDNGASWLPAENSGAPESLARLVAASDGVLVACGSQGAIVRSTDRGMNWSAASSGTIASCNDIVSAPGGVVLVFGRHPMGNSTILRSADNGLTWSTLTGRLIQLTNVTNVVTQANGVLISVGANIMRSVDAGANWAKAPAEIAFPTLQAAVALPDGRVAGVGHDGLVMLGAPQQVAPVIRRIVHRYRLDGTPVLRISLDDPAGLCAQAKCVSAEASSAPDYLQKLAAPRPLAASALVAVSATEYDLMLKPGLLNAKSPDSLYVHILLDVPGHRKMYGGPSPGSDLEVPNNPNPVWKEAWFQVLAFATAVAAGLLILMSLAPLFLLRSASALFDITNAHGFSGLGAVAFALFRKTLQPIMNRHPHVLNAWVAHHHPQILAALRTSVHQTPERALPYSELPVAGPDGVAIEPRPDRLVDYFHAKRAFVAIIAPGGSGKTRLALQICTWLFEGKLTRQAAVAIFVDEEFTDLLSVVQAKINAVLGHGSAPPEFIRALVERGRIWIVIDRLSERQESTRTAVSLAYRSVSAKVILCTSRLEVDVDAGQCLYLRPLPLDPVTLMAFLSQQLTARGGRDLFPDLRSAGDFLTALGRQISIGSGNLPVTPLLATIFVSQGIGLVRTRGIAALAELPGSVPEAYFQYVQQLDEPRADTPQARGVTSKDLIRRAATIVAVIELGDDFRPKPVDAATVDSALGADAKLASTQIDFLQRFQENGLLNRTTVGDQSFVEFVLDPLAECLAAFSHARRCGADSAQWDLLVGQVAARGDLAQGFMLALRMNHNAYATQFQFPPVAFPPRPEDAGSA